MAYKRKLCLKMHILTNANSWLVVLPGECVGYVTAYEMLGSIRMVI